MLLDEPFSSLDASLRHEVRQAVASTLRSLGATAILVTHDQSEALSMGDQVAVLRGGRIVQYSDPVTLYQRPADLELASFIGETVLLSGTARGPRADTLLGSLELAAPCDGPVEVLIRPEQIRVVSEQGSGRIGARISSIRYFGHDALIELHVCGPPSGTVTARVFGHALPRVTDVVFLSVVGAVAAYPAAAEPDAYHTPVLVSQSVPGVP